MKSIKFGLIAAVAVSALFTACQHDTDLFDGPALNDLYGEFFIVQELDVSNRNVDFGAGEGTHFTCGFSKNVNWTLNIRGLGTGAEKHITGFSSQLDAENASWDGSTTLFPLFGAEQCAVTLTIENQPDTLRDTLGLVSTKANPGFVVADFENGTNPAWMGFVQSGANMSFNITNQQPRAQGSYVYDMGGEVNWDWLIGMIEFPAQASGFLQFPLNENPDNVWFNVLLYRPPGIDNALILFQFREDENADGTPNEAEEDMWAYEVRPEEEGWQVISVRYSDLLNLVDGQPATANGNNLHEPDKLGRVSVLMLADPSSGYSQALIDYVIFTEGGPLNP